VKILLLDDDKICRRMNSESLRRAGYDTIEAASVKEAIDLLEKGEPIVLIITEIRIPEQNGLEFVAFLRSDPGLSRIPIVICTSLETKEWLEQAESFGVSAYSRKPINANHLRGKISQVLREETWPVDEVFRSLMRLDITVEDYFGCLDDLVLQLDAAIAQSEGDAEPADPSALLHQLDALSGAASNLGAQRISGALNYEAEHAKSLADGRKITVTSALKRETEMLKLAILILKKENEESIAARSAGRVLRRQVGREGRWKTAFVSRRPGMNSPPSASDEAAAGLARGGDISTAEIE